MSKKKLTEAQKNLLKLYERSKQDAEGWANVSGTVWPLVEAYATPDLFEVVKSDVSDGGVIRTTEAGRVLLDYGV